jgi:membrane protein implicated in regulation of membrane protease activity
MWRSVVRGIIRAEILIAIGFFAGCGLGGVLAGIASVFGGPVLYWGGLVALTLLFAINCSRKGRNRTGRH